MRNESTAGSSDDCGYRMLFLFRFWNVIEYFSREIEAQTGKRIVSPLTAKQALAEKTAEGIEHPEADTTE